MKFRYKISIEKVARVKNSFKPYIYYRKKDIKLQNKINKLELKRSYITAKLGAKAGLF